jgi:hypothetical protein
LSYNFVGKISAHFKSTPCISYFIKRESAQHFGTRLYPKIMMKTLIGRY